MFMMARMWGDPKKVPNSPESFWQLPGDQESGVGQFTEEEKKELAERFAIINARNG